MEKVTRSNVNDSKVNAKDFPKSGFDLSYTSRLDFMIGALHPYGYQHIMPADKFSGSSDLMYTFNNLSVPVISDVEVCQHNFYVPYRAIDSSFIKGLVPTELNGMSANWRTPSFSLSSLTHQIFAAVLAAGKTLQAKIIDWSTTPTDMQQYLISFINQFVTGENNFYLNYTFDWKEFMRSIVPSGTINFTEDNLLLVVTAVLEPFFGRNSLLDLLGYNYLRSYDIAKVVEEIYIAVGDGDFGNTGHQVKDFVSDIPMCEYAIRAYYAIWYEWYRDSNLQKRSNTLPDWRDFGSTSIFLAPIENNIQFLAPRFRNWTKDMFVGSMPDDISRHVYAPVLEADESTKVLSDSFQYLNAELSTHSGGYDGSGMVNATYYNISFLDPVSGSSKSVLCPLPKSVNDSLSTLSANSVGFDTYYLDLRDLRKSQMLERYLKRNFYFGDEYQDRMLAHYGSKVSDNSIRRPHLLSSSVSKVNMRQEVAPVSTPQMVAGTRTATGQDSAHGDAYEFFAEEFGIVISLVSVMPRAQYAGICPQNMLSQMTDFPLPEFANNNDEFGRILEVAQTGYKNSTDQYQIYQFGHYPYAHAWRSRVDEVHGSWLDDKQDWTFRRFFGLDSSDLVPKLNSNFIICKPNLGMFYDSIRLDNQGYMTADNHFYVERVLPTPVEEI